jgi:hypothetical protein
MDWTIRNLNVKQNNEVYTPRLLAFDCRDNIVGYNHEKGRMITKDQFETPAPEDNIETW